ncbi:AraC family transcriptional regulator [Ciceribacter sp. L1K23]|uniref:AraC family transcriptional regulator n=1 Tax=Ciceribacter sp. L1K23 TaxID=2820276 RepID=UPI001B8361CC|nr:AraC family transcriptional regulator [Ciceribacter sp. L1K23]MBR0556957.1 AraC family transcriptional regulator [Ciceribacter sp. L1K23]
MLDRPSGNAPQSAPLDTDLVSELLLGMRLVGVDYRRVELSPPFSYAFGEGDARAKFLFVARGVVILRSPSGVLHRMTAGDAALLPRGGLHLLGSSEHLSQPCADLGKLSKSPLCTLVSDIKACDDFACPPADRVLLFSACMDFDLGSMHPLISMMPEVMRVDTLVNRYPEILPMLEAMAREARDGRAGYAGILARLADVVAASIVRAWVECGCGDATGWIAALRDPKLGRVLVALHREPGRTWTLAELARQMGVSRSVFAERFVAATGIPPLRYLTEMRMRLAAQWIARDGVPVETAALRLGYGSQAAFSRAFKRVVGHPPSRTPAAAA